MYRDGWSTALRLLIERDARVFEALTVTLQCSLLSTAAAAILGTPIAHALGRRRGGGSRALLVVARTGMAIPTVVVGLLLYGLLSRSGSLGGWGLLYTRTAIVTGEFLLALPMVVALGAESYAALDARAERTALSLGAGPWRIRWALFREVRPGIIGAALAAFGRVVSELGIAMMLGGNIAGSTRTLTTTIALETQKGLFALGLAVGLVLLLFALGVNVVVALWRPRAL